MSVTACVPEHDLVPPEIVSTIFSSASVSGSFALLVAETVGGRQRLTWCTEGAVHLLGYGLDDLRSGTCPTSAGEEEST